MEPARIVRAMTTTLVLPDKVILGFCQIEGGSAPITVPGSSAIAVFTDKTTLLKYAMTRSVKVQSVNVSSTRLAGVTYEINPTR